MHDAIAMYPIGVIHTPHKQRQGAPIQPSGAAEVAGRVEVFEEFAAGLRDLDGFSHITLVFVFDRSDDFELEIVPFLDSEYRGVFATRAPRRPNPIGISTVRLTSIEDNIINFQGPDMLDGTPLLDIKPCTPELSPQEPVHRGWLEGNERAMAARKADDRFGST
ncbi:tRNA (N6-threonylcarbamoyladenosine(37)-N6)-methyltransferase TrmO [Halorhodospira halochloris]|uniref:Uncharacterized conserved protein n=1 Tax=Halorhodospira halochloris TaxID=1052 RepID=A0A0X8XCC3_HALHR|nr:tRNA (N6-threonylcarbamoyladenosine(37)-N6)-methyltransferase TrmO [Halorhodospira halochloris]MBK1652652.1 tRNA (N6-threonylcarbamoyladenosine(37)-N6)-methyltransferase TrmO [Halorhodospira halochloris]MCG5530509.1 tRNA (N6-threonylcarbamoyladenosine(37)-N6)-methyltransferase TrmO [Halorhodospira halochloris]MCG5548835.1 tRNA (N6-threonylcarbamoyladenosine(37)-N6)-methyltransferase TrmO [Halorhodospira halochloris]BAU57894.2 Uncharacterized conserved protein [Halorhodospira halochloris]